MVDQGKLGAMVNWLIAGAPPPKSIDEIVEECVKRLRDIGLPLDIITVNGLFIHPEIRGLRVRWSESRGVRRETYSHAYMASNAFYSTPTNLCMSSHRQHRYRLADPVQHDTSNYMNRDSPFALPTSLVWRVAGLVKPQCARAACPLADIELARLADTGPAPHGT